MSERVGESVEEGDDRCDGGDVRGRGARGKRGEVDVAQMGYDQDVLVPVDGTDGETTCEVAGRPLVLVEG